MFSATRQIFNGAARSAAIALCATAALSATGCGNNYRPVVSATNPVGPASQPTKYVTAISDAKTGGNGLITVVDVSGDTVLANAFVAPSPSFFALDNVSQAYVLHTNSVLIDSFAAQPGLMTNVVRQSSLAAGSTPTSIYPGSGSNGVYITEPGVSRVAVLTGGAPPAARQDLPVGANPVYTVGISGSPRVYTLSQGATPGTSQGTATSIENGANNTISGTIPVGISPIYGVMTNDARRAFVVNTKGNGGANGTVSVINTQANAIDTTITVGLNPVWAETAPALNELAVLNQGNGTAAGSLSVLNIPLCSALATVGNVACDPTNPSDAVGFGTVLGTIPVGVNPIQVAILQDLGKAYVANAGDGTVTVIDLQRLVATTTIRVGGKLNWIAATSGTPTGKVYVMASDTQVMTVIRTDTDVVTTTIPLQGFGVALRVSAP